MGQISIKPKPVNVMKSFIEKETFEQKKFIIKPQAIQKELLTDIFTRNSQKEKIKLKPLEYIEELSTFIAKRFKGAPVTVPAHVPANSSDSAANLSDSVVAFLQSHGVQQPAAGIGKYAAPKPATRAGI